MTGPESEKRSLFPGREDPEMSIRLRGGDPAPTRALEESGLEEIRLIPVFERSPVLADRGDDRVDAHRPAAELLDDGREEPPVELVEPVLVDLQPGQRFARRRKVDPALARDFGEVAQPSEQPIGDARRAPAPAADLPCRLRRDRDAEDPGRPFDDLREGVHVVEVETQRDAEAAV